MSKEAHVLRQIEAAIKAGKDPESYKHLLDQVLGTEMAERDAFAEGEYETARKDDE